MAHVTYRVSGTGADEKAIRPRTFRDTDAGRQAARDFAATLKNARTRYDVSYRVAGREHSKTFDRRKDADAFLTTTSADSLRGVIVDPRGARIPLKEVAEAWVKARTAKRPSSIARDQAIIDGHIVPALGTRAIGSITKADVQSLVDTWSATKAPSTVDRQYSCLRAIFSFAEDDEKIQRNPCRGIRLPQMALVARPELTNEQLSKLADSLGSDAASMMWLGPVLGLRWAEAAGMTVGRLDFLGGVVTVDRQLTRSGELAPTKSAAAVRSLRTPKWLMDALAALLARKGLTGADPDALVFTTSEKTPLDYTNWRRRIWVPACAQAKLPGLRFHDLRSMNATALIAAGVDVKTTQKRLGHSSPQVTLALYARATDEADKKASDAVGAKFGPRGY